MADQPPLMFVRRLGGLYPASPDAQRAVEALDGARPVRIEIKPGRGNGRRISLYWCVLAKAAPVLSEMCEGDPLTVKMLHKVLKERRGLYTVTKLPSGEEVKNFDSISFAKMAEPDRAEFIDWAFATLAKWIGCTVDELTEKEAA